MIGESSSCVVATCQAEMDGMTFMSGKSSATTTAQCQLKTIKTFQTSQQKRHRLGKQAKDFLPHEILLDFFWNRYRNNVDSCLVIDRKMLVCNSISRSYFEVLD